MTMSELHEIYERVFPSAPPLTQQGRAGVTSVTDWPIRNAYNPNDPDDPYGHKRICPVCCKKFNPYAAQVYCSSACKQRAYRRRKKATK